MQVSTVMIDFASARRRLVNMLKDEGGIIRSDRVERAMLSVPPREEFLPSYLRLYAYEDTPLEIMYGQTISAPHMVAMMCELLDLRPGLRVLEVGTGTGYHAAVCAEAMERKAQCILLSITQALPSMPLKTWLNWVT